MWLFGAELVLIMGWWCPVVVLVGWRVTLGTPVGGGGGGV